MLFIMTYTAGHNPLPTICDQHRVNVNEQNPCLMLLEPGSCTLAEEYGCVVRASLLFQGKWKTRTDYQASSKAEFIPENIRACFPFP